MPVATARAPDKPQKKSRPSTRRLLQNFHNSSSNNDNGPLHALITGEA